MNRFSFAAVASSLFFSCNLGAVQSTEASLNNSKKTSAESHHTLEPSLSYTLLHNEIIKNFPAVQAAQEIKKSRAGITFPSVKLSAYEMHDVLLRFLGEESDAGQCLDPKSITDLNLFFYNPDQPDYTILETTYRGFSINGKMAQGNWMVAPVTDREELIKRQDLGRYLIKRPELTQKLKSLFEELAALENELLRFWSKADPIYSRFAQETFYKGNQKGYEKNSGTFWLELHRRWRDAGPFKNMLLLELQAALILRVFAPYAYHKINAVSFSEAYRRLRDGAAGSEVRPGRGLGPWEPTIIKSLKTLKDLPAVFSGRAELGPVAAAELLMAITGLIPTITAIPGWWRDLQSSKAFTNYLRQRFTVFIKWQHVVKNIHKVIQEEQFLCDNLEGFDHLAEFATGDQPALRRFFATISGGAFRTSSYWFSNVGKVFQIVPQFLRIRHLFRPLFKVLGRLEALLSISTLMEEKSNSPAPWCFPTFKESTTPYIQLNDYSHPLIPASTSILNSLTLGDNGHQGMVVTGPNASGKSMNIRSIILSITLAQSLGIAPARSAVITPMSKILTYLNPVDNIAEGRSLFQAEEDRINYIVQTVASLPEDQFAFIAADELLSSTAPQEGEAATFGICYGLAQYPNCMPVIATHFVKLTALPQDTNDFYQNYHVSVIRAPNGDFIHPFKLEPGRAHQVIAIDLARQKGFDPEILDFADEFLKEHGVERGRLI